MVPWRQVTRKRRSVAATEVGGAVVAATEVGGAVVAATEVGGPDVGLVEVGEVDTGLAVTDGSGARSPTRMSPTRPARMPPTIIPIPHLVRRRISRYMP